VKDKKLNWGIIGAGIIAEKMADALHQNKNSNLLAVASKSEDKAKNFAEKNNVPIACSYEEIVEKNNENGFIYQVEEVVDCIRTGKTESNVIPVQETIDIMKLMDGMRSEWEFKYPFE